MVTNKQQLDGAKTMSTLTTFTATETVITPDMVERRLLQKIRNTNRRFRQGRIGFQKLQELLLTYRKK